MSFQLLFVLNFIVWGVLFTSVCPLLVKPSPPRHPPPPVTIDDCNSRSHSIRIRNLLGPNHKRNVQQTFQKRQHLWLFGMPMESDDVMQSKVTSPTRRKWIDKIKTSAALITTQQLLWNSPVALAKPDCYTDCYKNCNALAPKDNIYCSESCTDYCLQDDRQDGLSGSIGSEKGEVGILGGSFGTGTVVKGQDKPPVLGNLPGLDFTTDSGRKMIGY